MNKKGFTITEIIVALGLMAAVASIVVPLMSYQSQSNYGVRLKNALSIIEQATNEIIQDETTFPEGTLTNQPLSYSSNVQDILYCQEFIKKVNVIYTDANASTLDGTTACGIAGSGLPSEYTFRTINGMRWMFGGWFTDHDGDPSTPKVKSIWVDLDGENGALNISSPNTVTPNENEIAYFEVDETGKVTVKDFPAANSYGATLLLSN